MMTTTGCAANLGAPPDLESLRKQKGVALEEIARRTKIRLGYLEAIETGQFEQLPGGIYNTSYIRQYARAIDFPESELLAFYRAKTEPPPVQAPATDAAKKSPLQKLRIQSALLRGWI